MMLRITRITILASLIGLFSAGAGPAFTERDRAELLSSLSAQLNQYAIAQKIAPLRESLRAHHSAFLQTDDPRAFAASVTADMYAVTHDKHLQLVYSPTPLPTDNDAASVLFGKQQEVYDNYGQGGALRLQGNIGYLKIIGFYPMPQSRASIDAALQLLKHTDALIIDLRKNGGGDPAAIDYLMGYFFETPTLLTAIVGTKNGRPSVEKQFSARYVSGTRYLHRPLYVLTDQLTYSAAEQFAYDMKALHRAVVVGTATGGAANPGRYFRLNDHFTVFVPLGQARNPYTKTNWEGVGVTPDVRAASAEALTVAYRMALRRAPLRFSAAAPSRAAALKDPRKALQSSFTF
jgi:retinol-binding protein 3